MTLPAPLSVDSQPGQSTKGVGVPPVWVPILTLPPVQTWTSGFTSQSLSFFIGGNTACLPSSQYHLSR